jgi:hypothetical protein
VSPVHAFALGDDRVFVGREHRLGDRRGWITLRLLAAAGRSSGRGPEAISARPHPKGYVSLYVGRGHDFADTGGKVLLHRLVYMTHHGQRLNWYEHVHHKNEIKGDVCITNLELLEEAAHALYHNGQRMKCGPHVCRTCRGKSCPDCRGGVEVQRC